MPDIRAIGPSYLSVSSPCPRRERSRDLPRRSMRDNIELSTSEQRLPQFCFKQCRSTAAFPGRTSNGCGSAFHHALVSRISTCFGFSCLGRCKEPAFTQSATEWSCVNFTARPCRCIFAAVDRVDRRAWA